MLEFYCYFSPQYNFSSRSIIQNASQMITQIIDTCPSLLPVRRHLEWEEYSFFFFYVENFCVNYWNIFSGAQGYAALVKWVCNSIHCCKRHSQAGWKQRERKRKKKKQIIANKITKCTYHITVQVTFIFITHYLYFSTTVQVATTIRCGQSKGVWYRPLSSHFIMMQTANVFIDQF